MINIKLLLAEIEELGLKKEALAKKCGFSSVTLYNKLKKPETISIVEARKMAEALFIPVDSEKFKQIFFASEVDENPTEQGVS